MPVKGQFTACACLLFDRAPAPDAIASAVEAGGFTVAKRVPAGEHWQFHGSSVLVPFRPDVNGYATVDVVAQKWPDGMGDPQADPVTFAAWSMANFGPFAFPGGLTRAGQHAWGWPEGKSAPGRHAAFVRVRTSYVFGGDPNAVIMPSDYDPTAELEFVLWLTAAVAKIPGAIAFFNPNGEVLRSPAAVEEGLLWAANANVPPLDLIANVRLFNIDPGWSLMDTVGHSQFDYLNRPRPFPDIEAVVPKGRVELPEVDPFLRNTTTYLLRNGDRFGDGDTINGPGGNWRGHYRRRGLISPPRPTLRFSPAFGPTPPAVMTTDHENPLG